MYTRAIGAEESKRQNQRGSRPRPGMLPDLGRGPAATLSENPSTTPWPASMDLFFQGRDLVQYGHIRTSAIAAYRCRALTFVILPQTSAIPQMKDSDHKSSSPTL